MLGGFPNPSHVLTRPATIFMRKTVTFLKWWSKRDFYTDNLECRVKFSVFDSALIGTPRFRESVHSIKVVMTDRLMDAWRITGALEIGITDEMLKVALQSLEDYLVEQLKKGPLLEGEPEPLLMTTENSPKICPYKLANILYPSKTSFTVEIEDQLTQQDTLSIHPNIQILFDRMDDAIRRDDYPGVLHASANIFETLAKDIVGIPSIQDQTLKSFFERYRKDSTLPNEILNYILDIYESRNTTPLAGHGSTRTPSISREVAISLSEMTKAFVRIEYKLREKKRELIADQQLVADDLLPRAKSGIVGA